MAANEVPVLAQRGMLIRLHREASEQLEIELRKQRARRDDFVALAALLRLLPHRQLAAAVQRDVALPREQLEQPRQQRLLSSSPERYVIFTPPELSTMMSSCP